MIARQRTTRVALLALWWWLPLSVHASNCYSIQDPDLKNHCLATTKHDPSYCYRIKAPDQKNSCIAETKTEQSSCYRIQDPDQRNDCLGTTKHEASYCYRIKDPDERNACLGGVKVERSYCYRIQAPDERADCLAGSERRPVPLLPDQRPRPAQRLPRPHRNEYEARMIRRGPGRARGHEEYERKPCRLTGATLRRSVHARGPASLSRLRRGRASRSQVLHPLRPTGHCPSTPVTGVPRDTRSIAVAPATPARGRRVEVR